MSTVETSDRNQRRPRVAVLGGGISGLAAAHRLVEILPEVQLTLFEAADRLGGVLQTERRDGFLIERSADGFVSEPTWAVDLCRRVGLDDQLIETDARYRRARVVRDGRLLPVPAGFLEMVPRSLWPMITTRLLSWRGKLRLLAEPWIPARYSSSEERDDESVASFTRRRLGGEVLERLVQPLLAGMYTADAEKLSVAATMPKLLAQEREYGSLLQAVRRSQRLAAKSREQKAAQPATESGARYSLFLAPRQGMGALVQAIAHRLPTGSVRLGSAVSRLRQADDGRWLVSVGEEREPAEEYDVVIVAVAAPRAAALLEALDPSLAELLRGIEYANAAVISLGFRRNDVGHPLDCFGFVVPQVEGRRILAGSFASVKYKGRAPEGMELVRVFVGGALAPELATLPDAELYALAIEELRPLLGVSGQPLHLGIARWAQAMPQYHVGHLRRVEQIGQRTARWPGLALAGNAYRGVGIPQCVRDGELRAEQIAARLQDCSTT